MLKQWNASLHTTTRVLESEVEVWCAFPGLELRQPVFGLGNLCFRDVDATNGADS